MESIPYFGLGESSSEYYKSFQLRLTDKNYFQTHRVVSPRLLHPRQKREISETRDDTEEGGHLHHLTVAWVLDDKDVLMDLKLNRDLIPDSYTEKYQHEVRREFRKENAFCERKKLKRLLTLIP